MGSSCWLQATAITLRGTYQSSGQNCAGCERVLIEASVFEPCLERLGAGARALRQGPPLAGDPTAVDAGALALPGLARNIASLVDEAVSQGAKVGRFVPPCILRQVLNPKI